jgi:ribosomal protein S18 acetylase RimI-like enzyme
MDCLNITKQYYTEWLGLETNFFDKKGIFTTYTSRRDGKQIGYEQPFHLFALCSGETTIISYGTYMQQRIDQVEAIFYRESNLERVKIALNNLLGSYPGHAFKYYFESLPDGLNSSTAKQLTRDDYADYLLFRQQLYPNSDQEIWLQDFFNGCADQGFIFGIYSNEHLTCATETPDVPYMNDLVVEIGINTLPEYQRRGQAKAVCGALIKYLIENRKTPIWSCSYDNIASQKLADSLGYRKIADVITLTLPRG